MKEYDVIVVGLGAGGIGAALELSWNKDLKVAVVEKETRIGGTMIAGGVNCFEPGIAVGRVQKSLCEELMKQGTGRVQKSVEGYPCKDNPFAISMDFDDTYFSTLRRGTLDQRIECRRFMFDDEAMEMEVLKRLQENGVDIYNGYAVVSSKVENREIKEIIIRNNNKEETLRAKFYIDCTGNVSLAHLSGCKTTIGQESRSVYGEEIAPEITSGEINGVTLSFKMSKSVDSEYVFEPEIHEIDVSAWENELVKNYAVYFCCNFYPNGDVNINMLPTMTGKEYFSMPQEVANKICMARVKVFSKWIQENLEYFKGYQLKTVFPVIGIREDRKIIGKYVLTLKDMLCEPNKSKPKNGFVAYADHIVDMHGCTGQSPAIRHPYGIPYECLQTNEIDNLLVASKGASFSHIAASSCRLSRTIMDMGESAGKACKIAIKEGKKLQDIHFHLEMIEGYELIGKSLS